MYEEWTLLRDMIMSVFCKVQGCPVSNTCESPRQLYPFGAEHLFNYFQMQQIRSFFQVLPQYMGYVCGV